MSPTEITSPRARIASLLIGLAITGVLALSVHVGLQQLAGVPYPDARAVPLWAKLLRPAGEYAALVSFWWLARRPLSSWHPVLQIVLVALVYSAVKETLRGAVMNAVVTTAWTFNILKIIPSFANILIMATLAGVAARFPRRWWILVIAGLLLALLQAFIVGPAMAASLGAWVDSFAGHDHAMVYGMPYGEHVLVPAYILYVEPVVGACVLWMLTQASSGQTWVQRMVVFVFLLEFMTGEVVPPALWSFFGTRPWPLAFSSMAQFTLEHLVLALGVALAWRASFCSRQL